MRTWSIIYSVLFIILLAWESNPAIAADPWSKQDKILEGVYLILHAVDMGQTLDIASHPDKYYEYNPVLGKHPTKSAVYAYFIGTTMVHIGVTHWLPKRYRPWFQGITIGLSGGCVLHNFNIGLRVRF